MCIVIEFCMKKISKEFLCSIQIHYIAILTFTPIKNVNT